jgi:Tfp pilus assembly protein PilF
MPGERGRWGRIRSKTVILLGVSGALAVVAWLALDAILKEMASVGDEATTAVKLGVWPLALRMIRDFPAVGIGRGAFGTVYPAYKWEPLQRTFTHVENEWLQLPLELGVVAGVAVMALFAWAFVAAARRRDLSRPLAGALAGAGALAAHNLFDFSLEVPGVALPFAIVLGIAARHMPRVEVRPWLVRAAGATALAVAATGLLVHRAHTLGGDSAAAIGAVTGDDAVARARTALRWHPADYLPPAAAGSRLAVEDRCREAIPWLVRAMTRNPTAPEPHRSMASCLARAGRAALAKREFRLAFSYGDRTALEEANAWYPQPGALLDIAPDTPDGLWAAGVLLRDRPTEAAEVWNRAWESFREPRALAQLASTRLALHEDGDALALARELEKAAPHDPIGYVVAARSLDALGRRDEALRELELGAARLPGNSGVLAALGLRQLSQRRYSQARATFESIVAVEGPVLARKRLLVASTLEGQGRYQEALAEVQVARGLLPADGSVLAAFARIAEVVGRYDEAIDALEAAARQPATKAGAYDAKLVALRAARDEQRIRRMGQGR